MNHFIVFQFVPLHTMGLSKHLYEQFCSSVACKCVIRGKKGAYWGVCREVGMLVGGDNVVPK